MVKREAEWNFSEKIENRYKGKTLNLESKIRNNEEINNFIKLLFNRQQSKKYYPFENVKLIYANSTNETRKILNYLKDSYDIIDYTVPGLNRKGYEEIVDMTYGDTLINSHNVIGQEFDKICIILGNQFFL
ncbi:hypothetical protein SHJJP8921_001159 [Staphylococcus lugdunensis]|uniref:hypothetical protein n=1 Tax=Staphylococcus lugdunensis TaxID=28035 RepID=UPI001F4CE5D9|nr:hypothetical protein [Staphylococcus lugdunensis]MCH8646900.1 hypothetical protein [Staphylococcus lugdunensis]